MKWYKSIALVLACATCISCAACSSNNNDPNNPNNNSQITAPVKPVSDKEVHYVEGGLHKVNVSETNRPFIVDGKTDYKIIVGTDTQEVWDAANFLGKYVLKGTGVKIPVETYKQDITYNANSKYIVIACPELFDAAGLTMPTDNIGQAGYYIKSAGNSVFIACVGMYGYQNAVISFMHHVIGYEMYSADVVVFEKTGETLPDLDIVEKPDIEYRSPSNYVIKTDERYGMGFLNFSDVFLPSSGPWHNTFEYLPKEEYQAQHSDWYSADGEQLCYTAHGNETEYNAMVDEVYKKIVEYMAEKPNISNIAFTQQDKRQQCTCDSCQEILKDYNTISAAILKFCNEVSRKVQAHLEEEAEANGTAKRELNLLFFAYQNSEKPPVVKNADGTYKPIDESVVCDEHVGVCIAPVDSFYNKSFYDDANSSIAENIRGWGVCSQKLYMWLYETNFNYYFYPLNSYDSMIETYRFCFEQGAIYMYTEGQHNQPAVTCFGRFKQYLDAKAEFNVNVNFNDIADVFFKNYFKEAAEPMRQFFDELQGQLRYIEENYSAFIPGGIYDHIENEQFWNKRTLEHWLELCDEAYAAIEPYKTRDEELYEILRKNIMLETIFPRYALIRLHPGGYSASELRQMQLSFKEDAVELQIKRYCEGFSIDEIFNMWNV